MTSALLSRAAERDLLAAVRWIARENPTAAGALRQAISNGVELIGAYPEIRNARSDIADAHYRFLILTGFPYVMVYTPDSRPPRIVRILHGARDIPDILRDD